MLRIIRLLNVIFVFGNKNHLYSGEARPQVKEKNSWMGEEIYSQIVKIQITKLITIVIFMIFLIISYVYMYVYVYLGSDINACVSKSHEQNDRERERGGVEGERERESKTLGRPKMATAER